ncbi:porin [Roseateles saccharophilus]|uniref:Putative porin n=1 Tax=Roseateles saccharophilus TaxID=304 RepID=A0A4R3UKE7_ROSSA|nr:porin [Roseateles saccharophilus]MDG0834074.1 porin [Roseateles saccharophilus]TCU90803.1 putative porin [Roseateles saccharophilus]
MKKALIALAVLGLTGGAAVAQSSVTLFGVIDADMKYVKTGDLKLKKLDSSGLSTSRFGVKGVEDLGGGLKAGFWLESEVGVDKGDTGSQSAFWGRRSTVSLMGDFGEIRLGRYKTATKLHIEDFDPYAATGLGDVTKVFSNGLGSGATTFSRADNMVSYETPSGLGGFYGAADIAAGEGNNNNKEQDVRLGYKDGPIHVSAAFSSTGANTKYKVSSVAGSYDFSGIKPALMYTTTKFGSAEIKAVTAALTWSLGQGQLQTSYTDSKANDAARLVSGVDNAKLFAIGYIYSLSKRTSLYTTFSQIDNNGGAKYVVSGAPAATAGGQKSSGFDVGMRHSF